MKRKLTIFTPVYNRSNIIVHLYQSLCSQTIKDFEWIIVDDESSDDIKDIVEWFQQDEPGFEIKYFEQKHGGKHRAINFAVHKAEGEYFFIVDSDDKLLEHAVELVLCWIGEICNKQDIAGVAGLRISQDGNIWGGNPKLLDNDFIECSNFDRKKYNLLGDKAEVYKTKILKQHLFPEFEGEYFVTENVCWDAIAAEGYRLRWYNIPIYICEYLEDGLTKSGANEVNGYIKNYKGYCYYIRQSMQIVPMKERMFRFRRFNNTRKIMGKSLLKAAKDLGVSPLYYGVNLFLVMPVVCLVRKVDRLRENIGK